MKKAINLQAQLHLGPGGPLPGRRRATAAFARPNPGMQLTIKRIAAARRDRQRTRRPLHRGRAGAGRPLTPCASAFAQGDRRAGPRPAAPPMGVHSLEEVAETTTRTAAIWCCRPVTPRPPPTDSRERRPASGATTQARDRRFVGYRGNRRWRVRPGWPPERRRGRPWTRSHTMAAPAGAAPDSRCRGSSRSVGAASPRWRCSPPTAGAAARLPPRKPRRPGGGSTADLPPDATSAPGGVRQRLARRHRCRILPRRPRRMPRLHPRDTGPSAPAAPRRPAPARARTQAWRPGPAGAGAQDEAPAPAPEKGGAGDPRGTSGAASKNPPGRGPALAQRLARAVRTAGAGACGAPRG